MAKRGLEWVGEMSCKVICLTQIGDSYYHQNRRFFEASISQMFTGTKIYHSCLLGL